jgi:hypothetical protein
MLQQLHLRGGKFGRQYEFKLKEDGHQGQPWSSNWSTEPLRKGKNKKFRTFSLKLWEQKQVIYSDSLNSLWILTSFIIFEFCRRGERGSMKDSESCRTWFPMEQK